jgi:hypothetical protein
MATITATFRTRRRATEGDVPTSTAEEIGITECRFFPWPVLQDPAGRVSIRAPRTKMRAAGQIEAADGLDCLILVLRNPLPHQDHDGMMSLGGPALS